MKDNNEIDYFDEDQTMDLELEDGTNITCDVIGIFEIDDTEYIALSEPDNGNILIYIYEEKGNDVILTNIESDEEYEVVVKEFSELFEDLFEDEEENN